jgi:hypothetical protein
VSTQPPTEEELRAAYEAELARVTVTDMLAQVSVSLLNLAARRLGPPPGAPAGAGGAEDPAAAEQGAPAAERDLEQVRDAIDATRALLEILERRMPGETRPLRDALSQLQMAYAGEVARTDAPEAGGPGEEAGESQATEPSPTPPDAEEPGAAPAQPTEGERRGPGPAESSGRLWVPGR